MLQLPIGSQGRTPNFNPMGYDSEVFLHAPRMPKIVGEGRVGVILGAIFVYLLHCLLIQVGYLAKKRSPFDTNVWEHEETQQL